MRVNATLIALLFCLTCAPLSRAEDGVPPSMDIGGLAFGDLYAIPSHHLPSGDGARGVVLRRGYLTFDFDFTEKLFGRLRFEINQSGAFETYTFSSKVKDLYLGGRSGRQTWVAGLAPTLTFDIIEAAWGLRYLARTPMDLQGVPSRDTGFSIKGPLNGSGSLKYRAMLGSGATFESDSNPHEKLMTALNWTPAPGWNLDFYADFEKRSNQKDRATVQAFLSRQTERLRWGVQYSNQGWQDEKPLELASAYAVGKLGQNSNWIGRIDHLFKPSPKGNGIAYLPYDPTARATMFIGGVEFMLSPHYRLTPNVVMTYYAKNDEGQRPATDLYLRLTLFIDFE